MYYEEKEFFDLIYFDFNIVISNELTRLFAYLICFINIFNSP